MNERRLCQIKQFPVEILIQITDCFCEFQLKYKLLFRVGLQIQTDVHNSVSNSNVHTGLQV